MNAATLSRYQLSDTESIMGEGETRYVLRVKDLPSDEKPREKLLASGPKGLTMTELVAILLGVGTKKKK